MIKKIFLILILLIFLPQLSQAKVYLKVNKSEIIKGDQVKIYGEVKPKKSGQNIRIYRKYGNTYKYIKNIKANKKGKFNYYSKPSQDAYYRAKTKVDGKWAWGNKKKFVNVRLYPSCEDDYTWFSEPLIAEGDYEGLGPLGATNPTAHIFPTDHMYFYLAGSDTYNLYAPGKIWVTEISRLDHLYADPVYYDYSIRFRACTQFYNFLMHVSGISSDLQAAWESGDEESCTEYATGGQDYRLCTRTVRKKLLAGELLGTVGDNPNQTSFDWGAYDTRVEIQGVANQDRWYEQVEQNVCPIDYYDAENKSIIENYFGYSDNKREIEPLCGTIHQDVDGTAQGRWFLEGTSTEDTYPEDNHLALIHHHVNFDQGLFSVGDSVISMDSGNYLFTPTHSGYVNRDFNEVTADGQIYCYDNAVEMILIKLKEDGQLRIEGQGGETCGEGPWSFTEDYTDFER